MELTQVILQEAVTIRDEALRARLLRTLRDRTVVVERPPLKADAEEAD